MKKLEAPSAYKEAKMKFAVVDGKYIEMVSWGDGMEHHMLLSPDAAREFIDRLLEALDILDSDEKGAERLTDGNE